MELKQIATRLAIANSPQSKPFSCCWTSKILIDVLSRTSVLMLAPPSLEILIALVLQLLKIESVVICIRQWLYIGKPHLLLLKSVDQCTLSDFLKQFNLSWHYCCLLSTVTPSFLRRQVKMVIKKLPCITWNDQSI